MLASSIVTSFICSLDCDGVRFVRTADPEWQWFWNRFPSLQPTHHPGVHADGLCSTAIFVMPKSIFVRQTINWAVRASLQAKAMTKVLQSCPEFTNGWCYQDLGGSQKLRGPCPDHLICHYCLGLNPLMCIGYWHRYFESIWQLQFQDSGMRITVCVLNNIFCLKY